MGGDADLVAEPSSEYPLLARRRYSVDGADWKLRGAVYTPRPVADALVQWAVRGPLDLVLDPACGDGVFLSASCSRLRALGARDPQPLGVDVDENAAAQAGAVHADFFDWADTNHKFQAIVGNPPFIRSHVFEEASRTRAFRLMVRMGLKPSRLMNTWAPFLAICCSLLTPDGRLALVLPEELLQVGYALQLRSYLRRRFRRVMICFAPRDTFPDVQQSVVLLLCDNSWDGPHGLSLIQYDDLLSGRVQPTAAAPWQWCEKWTHLYLSASERESLASGFDSLDWQPLKHYARVEVGVVTGSNRFFVVAKTRAQTLDPRFLRAAVTSTRDLPGIRLTKGDVARRITSGRPAFLFSTNLARAELPENVLDYIREGERHGVHEQYKCRNRSPWYAVPSAQPSNAALFRQVGDFARLVQFEKPCSPTDTLHRVWWNDGVDGNSLATGFLNTWTLLATEITGRSYGGGVLEIMPREAKHLPVPEPNQKLAAIHEDIDKMVRASRIREGIAKVDAAVLPPSLSTKDRLMAADVLARLIERRKSRRLVSQSESAE